MITHYQRNNILVRIAAADAMSKFKAAQAQSFVQLARKDLNFDDAAKEVVLLAFDRFSSLLMTVEKIFVAHRERTLTADTAEALVNLYYATFDAIEQVLNTHFNTFDAKLVEFTTMVNSYLFNGIKTRIRSEFIHEKADNAIYNLFMMTSRCLQHLLTSMHEFNNNVIKRGDPFVSILEQEHFNVQQELEECVRRGMFFKNNGCGTHFVFKNYSSLDLFAQVKECFAQAELTLECEFAANRVVLTSTGIAVVSATNSCDIPAIV